MVLIEAFREGTPVVARCLGAYPEIVEQSGAGLLFTTTDELAGALCGLAGDRLLREKLGEVSRQSFRTHWSESVALEHYFSLIGPSRNDGARSECCTFSVLHDAVGAEDPRSLESCPKGGSVVVCRRRRG